MANSEFSTASALFLQSLVSKRVKLEMMSGEATSSSTHGVTAQLHGALLDIYGDALVTQLDNNVTKLVFAQAIRAVSEEPAGEHLTVQAVSVPGKARLGGKLF